MRKMIIMAVLMVFSMTAMAQKISYEVLAKSVKDKKTEQFGKAEPLNDFQIVCDGKTIFVNKKKYTVNKTYPVSTKDGVTGEQFDCTDSSGNEYIIKFESEPGASATLMQNRVIFVEVSKIYDYWTYYYTLAPEKR